MRIGIEINGVLRNTIGKIEQTYQKFYLDKYEEEYGKTDTYNIDLSGNTELADLPKPFKYEMNLPVTSLKLKEHFKFETDEELYSFLFEEFTMEIFGHAQSTEYMTFNDLNEIYHNIRDKHDLIIVSDEISKSKPASLFFLSKFGSLVENIKFYSNSTINSMWNEIDVLLTANPDLLLQHPSDKLLIKYETEYNKNINSSYSIKNLKELEEILNNTIQC